jgi:kynurenine formamidase
VGTHFDAPVHWITGRDGPDVASVPPARLVGPALVIDRVADCREDPDYLLTIDDVQGFVAEHGVSLDGAWLVVRTGWGDLIGDPRAYLNDASGRQRTPGFDVACARWLAEETEILGVGVETLGIDAGAAGGFDPPFPMHHHLLAADKYGLAQLANLGRLPATGAIVIAGPLRIPRGTGSPARILALVPR